MSHVQWLWLLDGLQVVLFACAWLGAAHMADEARVPMRVLALFNLMVGGGLLMVGLRGQLPYVVTHPLANLCLVVAYVLVWRAGQLLTARVNATSEQVALVLVSGLLVLWFGQSPDTAAQRVAANLAALAWVAVRGCSEVWSRLRSEGRPGVGWVMLATGWLTAGAIGLHLARVLLWGAPADFDQNNPATLALAFVLLVSVFCINMSFAYVVFARLLARLRQMSRHDALTGLLNRAALVEALLVAWTQHRREGRRLALLCIDIDHFKAINDRHGHAAGDAVLIGVAQALRERLRDGDVVGRTGGEEFVAVLPNADAAQAHEVAERLRQGVAAVTALHPDAGRGVTVSIGVAWTTGTSGSRRRGARPARKARATASCRVARGCSPSSSISANAASSA